MFEIMFRVFLYFNTILPSFLKEVSICYFRYLFVIFTKNFFIYITNFKQNNLIYPYFNVLIMLLLPIYLPLTSF